MGYRVLEFSFPFTLSGFLNPVGLQRRHLIVKSIQTEVLEVAAMNEAQTEDEVGLSKHVIAWIFFLPRINAQNDHWYKSYHFSLNDK